MAANTPAARRVFNIPELAEEICLNLTVKDVHQKFSLLNRQFRSIVTGSKEIQNALKALSASAIDITSGRYTYVFRKNANGTLTLPFSSRAIQVQYRWAALNANTHPAASEMSVEVCTQQRWIGALPLPSSASQDMEITKKKSTRAVIAQVSIKEIGEVAQALAIIPVNAHLPLGKAGVGVAWDVSTPQATQNLVTQQQHHPRQVYTEKLRLL